MTNKTTKDQLVRPQNPAVFIVLVCLGVFALDVWMPLGVATATAYIVAMTVAVQSRYSRAVFVTAVLCTVLTLIGHLFSPPGGEAWKVFANRALAVLVIWTVASTSAKFRTQLGAPPTTFLVFGAGSTFLLILAMNLIFLKAASDATNSSRQALSAQRLSGQIVMLDEALTMSARLGAASGDPSWEERYRRLENSLDSVLKDASAHPEFENVLAATKQANDSLVHMEHEAFAQVKAGNLDDATAILQSTEYQRHKQAYQKSVTDQLAVIEAAGNASTENQKSQVFFHAVLSTMAVLVFVVIWVAGARLLSSWIRQEEELTDSLKKSNEQLESSSERLNELNRKLNQSNAELREFAYAASHDLQEPLRKVTAFCQLLETEYGEKVEGDGQLYIRYAVDGAVRMNHLISDLLEYSRVDTLDDGLAQTDSNEACQHALLNLEAAIEESQAEIDVETLPVVMADHSQLVSLFQNLIGNAIKYCAQKPRVKVGVDRIDEDSVVFGITDNGIGIQREFYERIFQVFKRLHGRGKYAGTGIGLAKCRKIARRFGGEIWVESEIENGSTFFVQLRLAPSAEVKNEEQYAQSH